MGGIILSLTGYYLLELKHDLACSLALTSGGERTREDQMLLLDVSNPWDVVHMYLLGPRSTVTPEKVDIRIPVLPTIPLHSL